MTTATSWISKEPGRCGGEACVRDTRISVWGLVEWRGLGKSDDWILENFPSLTPSDLLAAWDYAAAHRDEMESAIRRNANA
jgi:uncharacterized protein (DUF433 family)